MRAGGDEWVGRVRTSGGAPHGATKRVRGVRAEIGGGTLCDPVIFFSLPQFLICPPSHAGFYIILLSAWILASPSSIFPRRSSVLRFICA